MATATTLAARLAATFALVVVVTASAAIAGFDWFDRTYSVELVATGPGGERSRGALFVGERSMRLEGEEQEIPYVVIYDFEPDAVVMHMLDVVSTTVMSVRFDLDDVVELDVLLLGAITLPPGHAAHPCTTHPGQASCYGEGPTTIRDEPAQRWTIELRDGFGYAEMFALWVAERDGRVLRTQYPDGYQIDFESYTFAPQPAERFEVPPEYVAPR